MKENQHVKPIIDLEANKVSFEVLGHSTLTLDLSKVHPDNVKRAALVGFAQVRVVDAAAVGMEDDEGNIIPAAERIAMKHARMKALIEHLESGTAEWSRRGTGDGSGARSITIEAIAQVKGWTYEVALAEVDKYAAAKFGGKRKDCLSHMRKAADVGVAILAIRAARMPTPKIDADNALAELGA